MERKVTIISCLEGDISHGGCSDFLIFGFVEKLGTEPSE